MTDRRAFPTSVIIREQALTRLFPFLCVSGCAAAERYGMMRAMLFSGFPWTGSDASKNARFSHQT